MEVLADAEMRLRDAASKKILLEVTLLKAIEARSARSVSIRFCNSFAIRCGRQGSA